MRPRLVLLAMLLLAPFAAPGVALAQPQEAQPLDRLLPEIRRTVPGQFLDAQGINRNGAPGYRLKWLTPEGRVIERDVDARTGRMMGPDRAGFGREGFGTREQGSRTEAPRGNFRPFPDGGDDGARFGNRGFPPRDFTQERQQRFGQDRMNDRFNRPGFEGGGFGRGERFGGDDGRARGFGGGRARGRAPEGD